MSQEFFSVYKNVISPQTCREIIRRFEESPDKHPGRVGDGTAGGSVKPEIKRTTELILDDRSEWDDVRELFMQSIRIQLPEYLKRWGAAIKVSLYPEVIRIQKYQPGDHFDWHSDNVGGAVGRMVTIIWYLNTVEEGGETEYVWQRTKIKPQEGSMLMCPVGWTYFHRGAPPVSGDKYIVITQLSQTGPVSV